jgi:DNA-directed RNA polymerase specialized sigma24 family protein
MTRRVETTINLLARMRQGDNAAVSELMERSIPPLRRWARGRIPHAARGVADTESIVQEAFVRALPSLKLLDAEYPAALQAVLRQAVADHIDDMCGRANVSPLPSAAHVSLASSDAESSLLERVVGREGLARYEAALRALAPVDREAIVARIELQQSYEEVAIALGKPDAESARAAVTAALARLVNAMA